MSTPWCVCRFCGDRFSGLYCADSRIRHEAKYCKKRKGNDVQVRKIAFKPDPPPAAASSDCAPSTSTAPQPALGAVASDPQMVWVCLNWGTLSCPLRACMNRSSTGGLHLWKPRRHLRLRLLFLACQKRIGLL